MSVTIYHATDSPLLIELKRELLQLYSKHLRSIILFGSYARGDFDDESDMDIMVLLDLDEEEQRFFREKLAESATKLSLKYGVLISAIDNNYDAFRDRASYVPFYANVDREGVRIYAS
ncbi:nucleotidyltransferase domain-containing protein [Bacillota bacterium]